MKKIFTTFFAVYLFSAAGFAQINLPFTENFSNGLGANHWTTDGANWRVSATMGNPMPCIIFYGNVISYDQSLISDNLNGTNYTSGSIILEFDIALSVINATGTEFLTVEVNSGTGWVQIGQYSNANGGISWGTESYSITSQVAGTNFKVRFRSHGANAANNNSWMIDNVHVFVSPVGVRDIDQSIANVYPNPSQGNAVNFKLTPEIKEFVIYDLLGNIQLSLNVNPQNLSFPVDISSLKNGIYPVKFTTKSGKTLTKKLIVSR